MELIAIDFSDKLLFRLKQPLVKAAIEVCFFVSVDRILILLHLIYFKFDNALCLEMEY